MIGLALIAGGVLLFDGLLAWAVVAEWRAYKERKLVLEVAALAERYRDAIPIISKAFRDFGISAQQATRALAGMVRALDEGL